MTIESQIQLGFAAAAAADRALRLIITGTATGNLSTLTTTNKTSIIAALNELKGNLTAFINDADATSHTTTYSAAQIESKISSAIQALIGGASSAYDTLLELQQAIQGDESQIAGLLTAVGSKVDFNAAQTLTLTQQGQARSNIAAAAQSDMTTAQSDITSLKGRMTTAETNIAANTTLLTNAAGVDYAAAFNTALNA